MIVEHRPQRFSQVGECEISSINYSIASDEGEVLHTLDETCLFWKNGDSRVIGDYDAHDVIVASLAAARTRGL